jgi:glycosyltransferase involved in cell wall biosynthesis
MNIAYIITGLGLGGAEIVTIDIANRMVRAGNRVLLLYLTGDNEHKHRICPQIEMIGLNMRKTPLGFLSAIYRARKILKTYLPDIVHGQMVHANIFARFLRIFYHFPYLISTEHSKNIGSALRMRIYRRTDFLSDFNTNVSQEAVNSFIEQKAFRRANSKAIYDGINLSRFTPNNETRQTIRRQYAIPEDKFVFINVGRLTEAKDQRNLIEAFSQLSDAMLMIVGDGDLRLELEQFVGTKGCRSSVIFTGAQQDVQNYYNAADCFVLSSAWEGFGIVLAEAMACGLPVITTDAGGCKEVVDNFTWTIPVKNSSVLAEKMKYMQSLSIAERQCIGDENRRKAMRYDIDAIVDQWLKLYTELVNA